MKFNTLNVGVLVLLVALAMLFACSGQENSNDTAAMAEHEHMAHQADNDAAADAEMAEGEMPWNKVCPVSGGEVDPAVRTVSHDGKVYGFCCPGCDEKFADNPEHFSKKLSEDGSRLLEM